MNTTINKVNELSLKIANTINQMIPEEWYKVLMYAEIEKEGDTISNTAFFYYYQNEAENPVYIFDIPEIFNIERTEYNILVDRLFDYIAELWKEFVKQKQKPWTNITFELYSKEKFDIKYDYTIFDENIADMGHRKLIWRYKNIGIKPINKYDIEFLKKYLGKDEL